LPDSHTLAACEEFLNRTKQFLTAPQPFEPPEDGAMAEAVQELLAQYQPAPLNVYVYGDATGAQRKTSATRTDWQIVKDFFGRYADRFKVQFRVLSSNPPVKDRINCVNALLQNHAGQHRLLVDPKCKELIKDLEQTCWKSDPHGNQLTDLDKSDPMRTHASDATGYLIALEFPMRARGGERGGPAIV
jgi:Terminase RNaseH-like domain